MRSHNHPIILFIDRNGFSVFQDTLSDIPRFNFTPDVVANLDVVNKEQFTNLIATFIQIDQILPSSLAVILSDTLIYTKDLINAAPSLNAVDNEHKEEIQNFLEDIPFEEVLAKVIKTDELNRIVAVNKDLVMTIANAFVNQGSAIEAIIPSFLYGSNVNFAPGLTQDNIQAILGGPEIMKAGNLLTDQQKVTSLQNLEVEQKDPPSGAKSDLAGRGAKPQSLRQYILIGLFVTLLIILAVVYFNLGASPTTPSKKIKSSIQTLTTTNPIDLKGIRTKILQNSGRDEITINIRNGLLGMGFQDIVSEVSQESTPEKSSIIFSKNIPTDLRERVITEVKKTLPDVSILENQDPNLAITILIGKS